MLKKIQIIFIISLFVFQISYSEEKTKKIIVTKKDLENFIKLSFDEVIFDENDLMKLIDHNGKIIIQYDWFENKKKEYLKNVKIFNENKELLITLVYILQESGTYQIHFKNNEEKRGVINIKRDPDIIITYNFDINYFKEGFELRYFIDVDDITEKVGKLYYNNDLVLFYKKIINSIVNKENVDLYVEKNFLENNKLDAGFWSLIFRIII